MLSIVRNAAIASARQSTALNASRVAVPIALRRAYATENNNEQEKKQEEQGNDKQQPAAEEKKDENDASKLLAEKDKKIAELQDAYIRCLADQENLRERTRKEIDGAREFAIQKFAKDLLDTVDILGMALTAVPQDLRTKQSALESELAKDVEKLADQLSNLYTGVSMTETELVKALKRHGVEQDNPEGQEFDPNKHQALFQTPMPGKDAGTVFVVQKMGYTLKGRVLRPAQVGVVAESQ
ncbi:GrpE-domain-containing protein [Phascolomyces articulosus]|uniref:GrpE protein homolog n=1 Tax=Phascolomyces articulosus TaxID=60185 RepID=A0AAD5PKR6_9FUNG|nr:GrpE-domain-containing protein [Phascolomyces articulosus]